MIESSVDSKKEKKKEQVKRVIKCNTKIGAAESNNIPLPIGDKNLKLNQIMSSRYHLNFTMAETTIFYFFMHSSG